MSSEVSVAVVSHQHGQHPTPLRVDVIDLSNTQPSNLEKDTLNLHRFSAPVTKSMARVLVGRPGPRGRRKRLMGDPGVRLLPDVSGLALETPTHTTG